MTGTHSSCGACKFLRRKCTAECVFTPYFSYSQGADHFAAVHRVFGASNVSKLLTKIPLPYRSEAAISIAYEALARMQDPVYGCVAEIFALEQQVESLQKEIDQLATNIGYVSFGVQNHASLQEINCVNEGLPLFLQFNDSRNPDHLNHRAQPLLTAPQPARLTGNMGYEDVCYYSFLDLPIMANDCNILNSLSQSF